MLTVGPFDSVALAGAATAFPAREWSNLDVLQSAGGRPRSAEHLRFSAESMRQTQGFWLRRWAHEPGTPFNHAREESCVSLGVDAATQALADAGCDAAAVDVLICCTSTPQRMTGTMSAAVSAALGLHAACFDLRTGCASGLFGLATAAMYLAAGARNVLLVGADTFSKVVPPGHMMARMSMADGAGALLLHKRPGARLHAVALETDGTLGKLVNTPGALPPTTADIEAGRFFLDGDVDGLAAALLQRYVQGLTVALGHAGLAPADCAAYVPHQTSVPLIDRVASEVGFDSARVFKNVDRHANIGAGGWLVALAEARRERALKGPVALAAVGGGMSWGAAIWTM